LAKFSGNIPTSLGLLDNLLSLILGGNGFLSTLPSEFGQLPNLVELDILEAFLTGTIPFFYASFPSLEFLFLETNLLTGPYPLADGLGSTELIEVNLSDNNILGPLPISLTDSVNLGKQSLQDG
jgi:hypothetical protein